MSGSVIGFDAVGGLIGRAYDKNKNGKAETISITNCTNNAMVQGDIKVAGIVGFLGVTHTTPGVEMVTVSGCTNNGNISGIGGGISDKTAYTYGILGFGFGDSKKQPHEVCMNITISSNTNTGNIENTADPTRQFAAYIAGGCSNNADDCDVYKFENNKNTATGQTVGGVQLVKVVAGQTDVANSNYKEADDTSFPAA